MLLTLSMEFVVCHSFRTKRVWVPKLSIHNDVQIYELYFSFPWERKWGEGNALPGQ